MFLHLLKNFISQSRKETGYTLLLIFTVALGLVFALCVVGLIELETGNSAPDVNRKRTLYLNEVTFMRDGKEVTRNTQGFNDKFTSSFLSKFIKSMKTPEKVSLFTLPKGGFDFSDDDPFSTNRFSTCMTDAEFWEILSFNFVYGKPYTAQQVANAEPLAVIDTELSLFLFGTTESVGKSFQNKGTPWKKLTVVGVIEKVNPLSSFASNVYSPYSIYGYENKFRNKKDEKNGNYFYRGFFQAMVLAKDKKDFPLIKAELNSLVNSINKTGKIEEFEGVYPTLSDAWGKLFIDWQMDEVGAGIGSLLGSFFLIILAIPIFTIARINSSRISTRMQELGVRRSFGATRRHILLQFLYENFFLTLAGGLLGLGFSALTFNFLLSIAFPDQSEVNFILNSSGMFWSIGIIVVFTLFTGIAPAIRASRLNPVYALSDGKTGMSENAKEPYNKISGFAIGGIFTCMVLILTFLSTMFIPTYKLHWVSTLNAHAFRISSSDDNVYPKNFQQLKREITKINGVKHVSFNNAKPFEAFDIQEYETPTGKHKAKYLKVDESYDDIIGIEMIDGKWFAKGNLAVKPKHKQAILSKEAAELFFGSTNCIGKTFQCEKKFVCQVVGINKTRELRNRGQLEKLQVFIYTPEPQHQALIQLHDEAEIKTVWKDMKEKMSLIPGWQLYDYTNLQEEYHAIYERLFPFLKGLGVVMLLMLVNAAIGFFAIGWSQVQKRRKEIGVRRASGARKINIYYMIIGEHMKATLMSIGIVMIPISQLILFFGTNLWGQKYWILASALSFFITVFCVFLAAYLPARKAAKTDPVIALSEE